MKKSFGRPWAFRARSTQNIVLIRVGGLSGGVFYSELLSLDILPATIYKSMYPRHQSVSDNRKRPWGFIHAMLSLIQPSGLNDRNPQIHPSTLNSIDRLISPADYGTQTAGTFSCQKFHTVTATDWLLSLLAQLFSTRWLRFLNWSLLSWVVSAQPFTAWISANSQTLSGIWVVYGQF